MVNGTVNPIVVIVWAVAIAPCLFIPKETRKPQCPHHMRSAVEAAVCHHWGPDRGNNLGIPTVFDLRRCFRFGADADGLGLRLS